MQTINKLIEIDIQTNASAKSATFLITDIPLESQNYAFEFACTLEANTDAEHLEHVGDVIIANDYDFIYRRGKQQTVKTEHLEILTQYMDSYPFTMESIEKIDNLPPIEEQ